MKNKTWPAVAFLVVGALGGVILGTQYGRRQGSSTSGDDGSLVGVSSTDYKNYEAEMKSNLRNLTDAQAAYFQQHASYGSSIVQIDARIDTDMRIALTDVSASGYRARAYLYFFPRFNCYAVVGSAVRDGDRYGNGIPWCDDRQR